MTVVEFKATTITFTGQFQPQVVDMVVSDHTLLVLISNAKWKKKVQLISFNEANISYNW